MTQPEEYPTVPILRNVEITLYLSVFYSEDEISDIALPFNNNLRYLRNVSSWNTEARFLVTLLQGHPSCITGVLRRSSLQELWSFKVVNVIIFFYWRYNPLWVCILQPCNGAIASSRTRFLDHTLRRATVGRSPMDE